MKPLRVNIHAVPSGGWQVPFGFNGEILRGFDFSDLVGQVLRDRQSRGVPVGNPNQEVNDYFCRANPSDCHGGQPVYSPPTLHARVAAWVASFAEATNVVDAETAQERAETGCTDCPNNKNYGGCCGNKQPQGKLATDLETIRHNQDINRYGSELHGCEAVGWDCRSAVWLNQDNFHLDELPVLPSRCWIPSALNTLP